MTGRQQWRWSARSWRCSESVGHRRLLHEGRAVPGDPRLRLRTSAQELVGNQYKTLADYKGQVVVLNVGDVLRAMPAELPSFQRLYRELRPKASSSSRSARRQVAGRRRFGWRRHSQRKSIQHVDTHAIERAYQTTGYPETFVIGREGTIRKWVIGAEDWNSQGNRALVAQLLGLETPRPVADIGDAPRGIAIPRARP
jgi:hypothetical protein